MTLSFACIINFSAHMIRLSHLRAWGVFGFWPGIRNGCIYSMDDGESGKLYDNDEGNSPPQKKAEFSISPEQLYIG